ncbi:14015_t:CDS:2 [Rhizophagus irregularis]|nr:14015_t:CDS:2 [Rhizophagus irregularis]
MNLPYHLKRLIVEKPFDPEEDISDEGIPKKHAEENVPNDSGFCRELASVYQKMGYEVAFFESSCRYYELICFSVEDNGITVIHNIVCIHERNNRRFAFIGHKTSCGEHPVWGFGHKVLDKLPGIAHSYFIDKSEITNQKKLECPVYGLRDTRPIRELDTNNTAHFIHHCNDDECISGRLSRFWE